MFGVPKGYENMARNLVGDLSRYLPWWKRLLMRLWPPYRRKMLYNLITRNPIEFDYTGAYSGFPIVPNDTWRN